MRVHISNIFIDVPNAAYFKIRTEKLTSLKILSLNGCEFISAIYK